MELMDSVFDSYILFQRLSTQWNYLPLFGNEERSSYTTGLNYVAVEAVLRILKVKKPKRMFEDIQAMELGWLSADQKNSLEETLNGSPDSC